MMEVLRALAATLAKMFVTDLWLTATALAAVGLCALGLRTHVIGPAPLPFLLAGGVLAALAVGVIRGARR
ncbi:MAG: hypothetical protein ABI306_11165 [Caulobacteraceae bacterium]